MYRIILKKQGTESTVLFISISKWVFLATIEGNIAGKHNIIRSDSVHFYDSLIWMYKGKKCCIFFILNGII